MSKDPQQNHPLDPRQQGNITNLKRLQNWFLKADPGESRFFSKRKILLLIGLAVYLISPIDLIPELFFGPIGGIDDSVVILLALWTYFLPTIPKGSSDILSSKSEEQSAQK